MNQTLNEEASFGFSRFKFSISTQGDVQVNKAKLHGRLGQLPFLL